ncbi:MAG: hypothetical protein CME59_01595 [Halioglobus sp.]|nr:hypothetical protein [Halioglobus sp.]|tara:strand:- start:162 stop:2291 length:2130 start_codon:yes stop_codon:yes gene_type:complete
MRRRFESLFRPGRIGKLELRNRIIMSPMGSNLAEEGGFCGDRIQAYYEARAAGGAAMVTMGSVAVAWPSGAANPRHVAVSEDRFIPGLTELASRVHKHGSRIALQLQHAGLGAVDDCGDGRPLLCPSEPAAKDADMAGDCQPEEIGLMSEPYMRPGASVSYRVAEASDIEWVISHFVSAAGRARESGIDGVEIHAGHGYLISNFLNPSVNCRTDEYGGSIENRSRLLVQIIRAIKEEIGRDYPVWCRLDSTEFLTTGGISVEDACVTAQLAQEAGADAIHCSAYADASRGVSYSTAHATHTPESFIPYAARIRSVLDIPVIGVGRLEPERARALIDEGSIDFVAMARKLLADPELPNKLREGRTQDIRPCIYCYTCISRIFRRESICCAVNPLTGNEHAVALEQAGQPKRVAVIGGGPAGMEAARVAASRGHSVTLFEKNARLGGTTGFSAVSYPENGPLVRYLSAQLRKHAVAVRYGKEVTADMLRRISADAVIVATGAGRELPPIPGVDLPHVLDGDDIRDMMTGNVTPRLLQRTNPLTRLMMRMGHLSGLTANSAFLRLFTRVWMPLGKNVALVGGGLVAVELAEFLAQRGRNVTILESGSVFGKELSLVRRWRNLHDIRQLGVKLLGNTQVLRIAEGRLTHTFNGTQERTIQVDTVILCVGVTAGSPLAETIREAGFDVTLAGDCNDVGYIPGAISQGFEAGRTV